MVFRLNWRRELPCPVQQRGSPRTLLARSRVSCWMWLLLGNCYAAGAGPGTDAST